jgi:hypothetical protein
VKTTSARLRLLARAEPDKAKGDHVAKVTFHKFD